MSLLLLLRPSAAAVRTASSEQPVRFRFEVSPTVTAPDVIPVFTGAAEQLITLRMRLTGARVIRPIATLTGAAEMKITLGFRASGSTTVAVHGDAWTGIILDLLDHGETEVFGAAELGVTLSEDLFGVVAPGTIDHIQHQGAAVLTIRSGFDDDGHVQPVITVPPQAQTGKTQVSVGIAFAASYTQTNLGDSEVFMRMAFEAGGTIDEHPKKLNVEFTVDPTRRVIVRIPPLADWDPTKILSHTAEERDPEYF